MFQSNSFGFEWLGVNFHVFLESNSAQILIFGVKYLVTITTSIIVFNPVPAGHAPDSPVEEINLTMLLHCFAAFSVF